MKYNTIQMSWDCNSGRSDVTVYYKTEAEAMDIAIAFGYIPRKWYHFGFGAIYIMKTSA